MPCLHLEYDTESDDNVDAFAYIIIVITIPKHNIGHDTE